MTKRLYDLDSHLWSFAARVTACGKEGDVWAVQLDQTAFFPEQGGQYADKGKLAGIEVLDVRIQGDTIFHYLPEPLPEGADVRGEVDWPVRFRRMQNHSGEHVVSGLVYARYGYENVGFHLSDSDMTMDFSGELTQAQLDGIEREANWAVAANVPVTARYPDKQELAALSYRSKLDLAENVRIVTIEGYDRCACCAPHVDRTGEIGMIRLFDMVRYKGGVRVHARCGLDALEMVRGQFDRLDGIARSLSVQREQAQEGVERLRRELDAQKRLAQQAKREWMQLYVDSQKETQGDLCLFAQGLDSHQMAEMACMGLSRCGGMCAVFCGEDPQYRYAVASKSADLRAEAKKLNGALNGRGGGKPDMIQGSVSASRAAIESYFARRG